MDESGLLMAPLLRRSWALRGQPPEQKQKAGHREKVSVAAALWLPPLRDRLHLAYQTLVNGYLLIPVEFLWTWLKYDELCNFAPRDASHLNRAIVRELDAAADNQELLQSFFHLSALHLPRTLLS